MMSSEHPTGRRISRQWLMVALSIGLALAVALSMALAGDAEAKKKKKRTKTYTTTSTVSQAAVADTPLAAPVTYTETPYTFARTKKISTLTSAIATLTASVKDPADEGLVLGLDGIDTGIRLRGLGTIGGAPPTPITVSGRPENASEIVGALKADGQLVGSVIDRTPATAPATANTIVVPGDPNTTLTIRGKQTKKRR
jgi:hypothetical protein